MKLLAGLITSVLTATMLALGVSAPAQAACDNYGPCIDTRLSAWSTKNPIRARQRAPFAVRLRADDGRSPDARLDITVKRRRGGEVVWTGRRFYDGGKETYRTGRLAAGRYRVVVKAHTVSDRYQDDRTIFGQRVTRR